MARAYWKRFAESATGFASRYRRDIFYRTGWNVLALQIAFALILIGIVLLSLGFLYDQVVHGLLQSLTETLASGKPSTSSFGIALDLEYDKQTSMVLAAAGILVAAAVFSWLITRIALRPTRNALESQKRFIGNVAHELRTPLAIIKTNTEVLLLERGVSASERSVHESNLEELDRISDIINNLLTMNALMNPEKVEFKDVEIAPAIERAVHVLGGLAAHKRIQVEVGGGIAGTARGNPAAVDQIITNVLKNAIAYTGDGGEVRVSVAPDYFANTIALRIQDNGIGMDENDLEHVLEPFYRSDRARTRRSGGGSGLGLAIVSELVKLHKGNLGIESKVGRGTTVTVTLPLGHAKPLDEDESS